MKQVTGIVRQCLDVCVLYLTAHLLPGNRQPESVNKYARHSQCLAVQLKTGFVLAGCCQCSDGAEVRPGRQPCATPAAQQASGAAPSLQRLWQDLALVRGLQAGFQRARWCPRDVLCRSAGGCLPGWQAAGAYSAPALQTMRASAMPWQRMLPKHSASLCSSLACRYRLCNS